MLFAGVRRSCCWRRDLPAVVQAVPACGDVREIIQYTRNVGDERVFLRQSECVCYPEGVAVIPCSCGQSCEVVFPAEDVDHLSHTVGTRVVTANVIVSVCLMGALKLLWICPAVGDPGSRGIFYDKSELSFLFTLFALVCRLLEAIILSTRHIRYVYIQTLRFSRSPFSNVAIKR